jgi:hypothetical protein
MATKEQKAKWAREWYQRKKHGLPQPRRGDNLRKHGLTFSPEHRSWLSMMTRCVWNSPDREDWPLYQGRGIKVCDRWMDFSNFLADMGNKPTRRHTIDRIDSDGNYEPGNCRWATSKQQGRNKRSNRLFSHAGRSLTLGEWSEILGISRTALRDRIDHGWPVERALTTPVIRSRVRDSAGHFLQT